MDSDRFLRELPGLFDDFPRSEHPRDRRFAPVLELENLASENVLALLNLAASCLGPDEAYVEVGVYHGASLIAAMLGNEEHRFVAVDSFVLGDHALVLDGHVPPGERDHARAESDVRVVEWRLPERGAHGRDSSSIPLRGIVRSS